jgi:hypothetical protein
MIKQILPNNNEIATVTFCQKIFGSKHALRIGCHIKLVHNPPVRLSLSAVEQCFSLTANQPQPAYKPKKQPAEQGQSICYLFLNQGVLI